MNKKQDTPAPPFLEDNDAARLCAERLAVMESGSGSYVCSHCGATVAFEGGLPNDCLRCGISLTYKPPKQIFGEPIPRTFHRDPATEEDWNRLNAAHFRCFAEVLRLTDPGAIHVSFAADIFERYCPRFNRATFLAAVGPYYVENDTPTERTDDNA